MVSATMLFTAFFNQHEDMFLLQPPNALCVTDKIGVYNNTLCSVTYFNNKTEILKCKEWQIKVMGFINLEKTWLIFCDHKLTLISAALLSRLGSALGCIIYGLIADRFGRKIPIIINVISEITLGAVLMFCDSKLWSFLFVFLKSLFASANIYLSLVTVCEIASNEWRSRLCFIVAMPRLLAYVYMVPLTNNLPNIETHSLIGSMLGLLYLILLRWYPESPQWLLFNGMIHKTEKLLFMAAKRNGIKLCNDFKIKPADHKAYYCLDQVTTCLGFLTTHNVRVTCIVIVIFWILYNFLWSCLYVQIYSEVVTSLFLLEVFSLGCLVACLTIILSAKIPFKHLLFIHVVVTGVLTACVKLFDKNTSRRLLLSIALGSGITVHALILNVTPRLFAINIRATIFGCCHAAGQLGSIISYTILLLTPTNNVTQICTEVLVTIVLIGLCFMVLDVDRRELPDVLEDMDYFSELSKPLRWATQKTNSPSQEETEIRVHSFGSAAQVTSMIFEDRQPAKPIGCARIWKLFSGIIHHLRRLH
uniref:Uncharacterized protein n=1 Tax=Bombyx mori TaxID=7091 RepID=A0A8R2HKQ5_BOMMO|nr:solute carrier family 22 member 2-like isoform X1 [Bombyx mori]